MCQDCCSTLQLSLWSTTVLPAVACVHHCSFQYALNRGRLIGWNCTPKKLAVTHDGTLHKARDTHEWYCSFENMRSMCACELASCHARCFCNALTMHGSWYNTAGHSTGLRVVTALLHANLCNFLLSCLHVAHPHSIQCDMHDSCSSSALSAGYDV